jgi:hypothetical protein
VERFAEREHQTVSELVRAALRAYMRDTEMRRAEWKRAMAYGAAKRKEHFGTKTDEEVEQIVVRAVRDVRAGDRSPYARSRRR